MRILGIDYGDRHIGLALSDPLGMFAQPLETYILKDRKAENAAYFRRLIQIHEIGRFVLGMPLRMDGTAGTRAEKTREFAKWLEGLTGLPVVFWDERLTTQQATAIMHEQGVKEKDRKSVVNQISASLILQAYLTSMTRE
ncbi:MAG: Holliday junction resolvase RuvX [Candidatus Aminicenantes bacterium]|nr:Holliday junction resolvase RuvX [Candidatus Aminicenantes bacterium]